MLKKIGCWRRDNKTGIRITTNLSSKEAEKVLRQIENCIDPKVQNFYVMKLKWVFLSNSCSFYVVIRGHDVELPLVGGSHIKTNQIPDCYRNVPLF